MTNEQSAKNNTPAMDALHDDAVRRLEQIEIMLNAHGLASPGAISAIRNYIQCSRAALAMDKREGKENG